MKSTLLAVLASLGFALSQPANAETLLDLLFPKSKKDAGTSRPALDNSPTGSVAPAAPAKAHADSRPATGATYPEAFYWNYQ